MIRIFTALLGSAIALISASCCCTSDVAAPGLRELPAFQEIQTTTTEVNYSK